MRLRALAVLGDSGTLILRRYFDSHHVLMSAERHNIGLEVPV